MGSPIAALGAFFDPILSIDENYEKSEKSNVIFSSRKLFYMAALNDGSYVDALASDSDCS